VVPQMRVKTLLRIPQEIKLETRICLMRATPKYRIRVLVESMMRRVRSTRKRD
jgi:hypothetical protein